MLLHGARPDAPRARPSAVRRRLGSSQNHHRPKRPVRLRIRVPATGTVYGCLGHDQKVELRNALRERGPAAMEALRDELLAGKPRRHGFRIDASALPRRPSRAT